MTRPGGGPTRLALVTGGGRGIGRACALALAGDGCDVAVAYRRDAAAAQDTVAAVEALGSRARTYQASVESLAEDQAMVDAVVSDFGAVDILVHAAGIASRGHSVVDTDPAELERVIAVHALAAHHLCRLVLPSMRASAAWRRRVRLERRGAGLLGAKSSPYNMAKAALRGAGRDARQGGACPRGARQRGGTGPGGDRDGPAPRPGRHGGHRHRVARRRARRTVGCAAPRTWPGSCGSCAPTTPATSPVR